MKVTSVTSSNDERGPDVSDRALCAWARSMSRCDTAQTPGVAGVGTPLTECACGEPRGGDSDTASGGMLRGWEGRVPGCGARRLEGWPAGRAAVRSVGWGARVAGPRGA